MLKKIFLIFILLLPALAGAQSNEQISDEIEDELNPGSDIFSDFNEDLEASQVLEDERFYRYGRFFSVNLGGGFTTFTGNRGNAYDDNHPTFHLSTNYFMDFQQAIMLGVEYSKHTMVLDTKTNAYQTKNVGAVQTDFTRVFVGYKYYIDTTDLGTAITYSNPYFIGRFEYWYQTNKFVDRPEFQKQKGGGIGTGIGFGLEFPIELKKSYIGVEFLFHVVNFFDKYTQDYRKVNNLAGSTYGYDDLTGNVISIMITYNFTW
ncbi:MAG: hypothetical protein ACJ76H_01725 [Bacteriovoracaceae bacterium]